MDFFTEAERVRFDDWEVHIRDEDGNVRYAIGVGSPPHGETLVLTRIVDPNDTNLLEDGRTTNISTPVTSKKAASAAANWVRNARGWNWANESDFA